MELKSRKNVLCLIVVGLLDLRVRGQSDITGAERRGVFGDLRLNRFLHSEEKEGQCAWCVVSSFASVSISFSLNWSSGPRTVDCLLLICVRCREICLLYRFSLLIGSDWVFFVFYREGYGLIEKLPLIIFIFWQISSTFRNALILCAKPPFLPFQESLSTDNIQWMLSWALVAIIILCVQ